MCSINTPLKDAITMNAPLPRTGLDPKPTIGQSAAAQGRGGPGGGCGQ